ncbi:SGNH/GDSL hydrolase family protein [Sinorhizobium meliloti]|uniref:SGNH/GDSL hydrolase family protein n=1 Tax=Rhizobium meliloti TaxID=382 RepID=UPI000FDA7D50|nr:SGNH/GDSL hydrolase family protein [Sinorhizobium meliloti]RVQ20098.1 hypothetical protein CN096_07365 [Sinorhizobium meliloti]
MANEITNAFNTAWADGPTADPYEPSKSVIRGVGQQIQSQVDLLHERIDDTTADLEAQIDEIAAVVSAGTQWVDPVAVATTANITLSGEQTIDGVVTSGSRVLVKNQSAPAQNGIYVTAAGAWPRATDADAASELVGLATFVSGGTANGGKQFICTTKAPVTVGTTALTFREFSDQSALNANLAIAQAASAVAVSEVGTVGLVVARNGTSWKLSWDSANGIMNGNIISIAAFASTPLAPAEGIYIDVTGPSPYTAVKAFFGPDLRNDVAAGRKIALLFNAANGALSGVLADNVLAAFDSKTTNSGKLYPLAQRTRNNVTSARQTIAWKDALLDVRVEGAIPGEVYQIAYYENGVPAGEGWIIYAFNAATMASSNAPLVLVDRVNQQTPIVRGAGIQTIRIVPPARQDMAFVITVNPDALPASGTAIDSVSSSSLDGWSWIIDPSCYTSTAADAELIAELATAGNIVANPRLSITGTPPVFSSAPPVIAAAEAPLAAHYIERAYEIGTGGVAFFERIAIPSDPSTRVAHICAYVWSATGADWPSLVQAFRYIGATSQGVVVLADIEQLSANLRRVSTTMTIPAGEEGAEFRLGVPGGALVSGARAQLGGFQILMAPRPVSYARIPRDRWGTNIALALQQANHMVGKRIAIIGDSIIQNYDIPAMVSERLGCAVVNLGFGGCRMTWSDATTGLIQYKRWFSASALADAVASGNWANQISAADGLYADPGRFPTDDFRAVAAEMALMDWSEFDAILVTMGTNDYGAVVMIGDDADTDLTHFAPAVKNVISQLSDALPTTRLVFAPPMWRGPRATFGDTNISNNGLHWMHEYQDAIIERSAYSQVPILPLHLEVGINVDNTLILTGDDLHPSVAGRARISDVIASGLRRVL